jgi:nucleoside-diphosphate-sugar epimerase
MGMPPMTRLLCLGAGYCALELARRRRHEGWSVIATGRKPERLAKLRASGFATAVFDGTAPSDALRALLSGVTHVLISLPPDEAGDPFLRHHGADLLGAAPTLRWIGYLSSTGVYGDHGGGWVNEDTPPAPVTRRDQNRLTAECQWHGLSAEHQLPVHIFRLGGIYGPGDRNPLQSVRQGTARRILKPGQYFGRIHRDDIVGVLEASQARPDPGRIYNVVDDEPTPPEVVPAYAAELLGLPVPPAIPFAEADLSPAARGFYAASKRVRNDRIRRELGYALLYPTYREGLAALLTESD